MSDMLIKIVGYNLLHDAMQARRKKLIDRTKTNAAAVAAVDAWIQKNFEQQGKLAMDGKEWQPLQSQTLSRRRHGIGGGGVKVLQDIGTMKKKWKHMWNARVGKIQSGVEYSRYHHEGTKFLPVRRIIPSREQVRPILTAIYKKFIRRALK